MRLPTFPLVLMASVVARGSQGAVCKESSPGLAAQARVSCQVAAKTALARVPHAKVQSAELERENGRLLYSFDLRRPHVKGIEEVQVDAISGAVFSVEHEDAAAEEKEKTDESRRP